MTDRKALEARLVDQAFHDPLTGLANRRLFYDRVEHALQRSTRRNAQTVVAFIDIDAFKRINDTRGHEAGDQLLAAVAARITGALRAEDTAARLGGDGFAVLFEEVADLRPIERRAQELAGSSPSRSASRRCPPRSPPASASPLPYRAPAVSSG